MNGTKVSSEELMCVCCVCVRVYVSAENDACGIRRERVAREMMCELLDEINSGVRIVGSGSVCLRVCE